MIVTANGKKKSVGEGVTVKDLLDQHSLAGERVVIEYNGEPLPREHFALTILRHGDSIEIAQMVGGG
jgi:thiamine biosynthesis protein ThiS